MTQRRQTDRDFEAELNALFEAAVEGIVIIDDRGTIEAFSRSAERIFGYKASEVLGQNVRLLMPNPYREEHDRYLENYNRTRVPKIIGIGREVPGLRKDGSTVPIDLSVGEIRLDKKQSRFLAILRDISSRKESERQLSDFQERLAHAGRVGEMGEMATGMAHEINQPLTAIASYAQACKRILAKGDVDATQLSHAVEQIAEQAIRAGTIIERLRAFVRKRHMARTLCDVNTLVREVTGMVASDARLHETPIVLQLADDIPAVLADGVQIQQVVLNLVRNGLESMENKLNGDRSLMIRTRHNDGEGVMVEIEDHGTGLSRDLEEKLFSPYVTTKDNGLGLGLSISRTIIESHGGRLWFTHGKGGGTVFHFTLEERE